MTHPLLTPRYMVEADYPNSPFSVGDVLTVKHHPMYNDGEVYGLEDEEDVLKWITYAKDYPHIFRKMHWSEQRELVEMPRWVNRKGVIKKVLDPKYDDRIFGHKDDELEMKSLLHGLRYWKDSYLPATEDEYLEYLKSKEK